MIINKQQYLPYLLFTITLASEMKATKLFKLPQALTNNQTSITLRNFMSQLGANSGYLSYLLHKKNDKYYFVQKDPQFPFIPFDWTMFSLMRAHARTIVDSGLSLREEYKIFGDDRGSFGNQQINKIYQFNNVQPFNLLIHTKTMTKTDIQNIISKKSFRYIPMQDLGISNLSFKEAALKINSLGMGPVIYQYGQNLFQTSMSQVRQDENSFLQIIVLSLMQGPLAEKYVGKQYDMSIINRDFNKAWESDIVSSQSNKNENKVNEMTLKYVVYLRKQKGKKQ